MATRTPILVVDGDLADTSTTTMAGHEGEAEGARPPGPAGADAPPGHDGQQPPAAGDRYILPAWTRALAVAYTVVSPLVVAWLARAAQGERAYFMAMGASIAPYAVPIVLVGRRAVRGVAEADRVTWRLWFTVSCVTVAFSGLLYLAATFEFEGAKATAPVAAGLGALGLSLGNTVVLRKRSGQRTPVLDAIDLLMATLAVIVPVSLLVAEPIVTSEHAWYTVSCSLAAIGWLHGMFVAMVLVARLQRGQRVVAALGLGVAAAAVFDSCVQVVQGIHGFGYRSGLFVGVHAACLSLVMLFYCFAGRQASTGLDRFPAQRQVRRSGVVALGLLVAVPVIAVEAWIWHDRTWVVATAVGAGLTLLAMSCVRHLLLVSETTRLYRVVEEAAEERKRLLADVMAHADRDRGRAAAHLHRQAVSLHTAMASFAGALESPAGGIGATVAGMAADRMRRDLARQVDWLRQILTIVAPVGERDPRPERLAAPIRAYVGNLYGDGPRPRVTVEVDPALDPDWTTEVVAFRIVQEAIHNVWRHARASSITVTIGVLNQALDVVVTDDGVGFETGAVARESGIATMRALAEFTDGRLEVASMLGYGTQVRAVLGEEAPTQAAKPDLRLVDG
jgi:signal transduction histidine kinase